jgi:hypothetical protein
MVVNRLQDTNLVKFTYSPKGFKVKLLKKNVSNGNTYFFLELLMEIFILKTTMYHKYRVTIND